jgi:hypothetical protein
VAQQSISQIRTVVAYNQVERSMELYEKELEKPRKMVRGARAGPAWLADCCRGDL